MNAKDLILAWVLLSLTGCAATSFSRTGSYRAYPRAASCDVLVYPAPPSTPFKEIGSIRFISDSARHAHTSEEIENISRHDVCKAGGNGLILGAADKDGFYQNGTVIWMAK